MLPAERSDDAATLTLNDGNTRPAESSVSASIPRRYASFSSSPFTAACGLSPRIRDLGKITLYRTGPRAEFAARYPSAGRLLSRRLNEDLITDMWDDLLRVAASVKGGHASTATFTSWSSWNPCPLPRRAILPAASFTASSACSAGDASTNPDARAIAGSTKARSAAVSVKNRISSARVISGQPRSCASSSFENTRVATRAP